MKIIFVSYASHEKALREQQHLIETQKDCFAKQGIELSLIQPKTIKSSSSVLSSCVLIHSEHMTDLLKEYDAWSSPTPAIFFNSLNDNHIFVVNGTQREIINLSRNDMRLLKEYYSKNQHAAASERFIHLDCEEETWFKGIYKKLANILADTEDGYFDPAASETIELHNVLEELAHDDPQTIGIALEPPDEVTSFYDQNKTVAELKPVALVRGQLAQVQGTKRRHDLTPNNIHQVIPPEQTLNLDTLRAVKNLGVSTLVFIIGHERRGIPKHILNFPRVLPMSIFGQPANIATYQAFLTALSLLKMNASTEKGDTSQTESGEASRVNYTFNTLDDLLDSLEELPFSPNELVDETSELKMDLHTSNTTLLKRRLQEYLSEYSLIYKNKVSIFRSERFLYTPASFDLFICTKSALNKHQAAVDNIIQRGGCVVVLDKASKKFQIYPLERFKITRQLSDFTYKMLLACYQNEIQSLPTGELDPLVHTQSTAVKNHVAHICNAANFPNLDTPITLTLHKPHRKVNFYFVDSTMFCSPDQIKINGEEFRKNAVEVHYDSLSRTCYICTGDSWARKNYIVLENCTLEQAQQLIQKGAETFLHFGDANPHYLRLLNLFSQFTGSVNMLTQNFLGIEHENPEYLLAYGSQQHHNSYSGDLIFSPLITAYFPPELPLMIFISSPSSESSTSAGENFTLPVSTIHYDDANVLFLPKPPDMDYLVYQNKITRFLKEKVANGYIFENHAQIIPMTPDMDSIDGGDVSDALVRMEANPGILQGYSLSQFFSNHERTVETVSSLPAPYPPEIGLSLTPTAPAERVNEAPIATTVQAAHELPVESIPSVIAPCLSQTGLSLFPNAPAEPVNETPSPTSEEHAMSGKHTAG